MTYDFNKVLSRAGLCSSKFDDLNNKFGASDILPMWVADMDLPTASPILEAISKRTNRELFGYTTNCDSYNQSVIDWQKRRNNWTIDKALLSQAPGVVPAINTIINEFSNEQDEILFFAPVYGPFASCVKNFNRKPLISHLTETDGYYTMDFDDFEEKLKRSPAFVLLCSPHNPIGRLWTKEELIKISELCLKYKVLIVSDEIHSDLILGGRKHIPMASLSTETAKNTITCLSATKTFNLAGLHASIIVLNNLEAKKKFEQYWKKVGITQNNVFSTVAVEAAFNHGEEWLDQLLIHLNTNVQYVKDFIDDNIPELNICAPEATYLLWIDCRRLNLSPEELDSFMVKKAKLGLSSGTEFVSKGEGFMRMNIACSFDSVKKAMEQLKIAVESVN